MSARRCRLRGAFFHHLCFDPPPFFSPQSRSICLNLSRTITADTHPNIALLSSSSTHSSPPSFWTVLFLRFTSSPLQIVPPFVVFFFPPFYKGSASLVLLIRARMAAEPSLIFLIPPPLPPRIPVYTRQPAGQPLRHASTGYSPV